MRDDGGPALPAPGINPAFGLSLRDYFAAAALAGGLSEYGHPAAAKYAYLVADAMLAERAKK